MLDQESALMRVVASSLLLAVGLAGAARAKDTAETEIKAYYSDLEHVINSEEYQAKDPTVLWRFQDVKKMRLFDLMGEDEYIGAAYQKHITETATKIRGRYEFGPLDIHADGKVAFVVYMQNFYGKKPDGTDYVIRCRTTDGLEKTLKGWRMVHEHVSIALDEQSFLAIRGRKNWDDNADK
jgi:ketosteroid isomerase-like protein